MSKSNTELLKTQFLQLMVITMEECGELIQECSKSMRRNDENHQPLKDEIGDVYCMIQLCKEYGIITQKMLDDRVKYYSNPSLIVGKEITVQYFELSKDKDGIESLRFPVVKHVFEEGVRTV